MPKTTTSYTGRKVDLLIFQNADYTGKNAPVDVEFSTPSKITSGVQKAVQRWALLLLTRRGTVLGDVEFGTTFMTKLLARQLPDDMAVQSEFAIAVRDISDYLLTKLSTTTPDDEIITEARLLPGWQLTRTSLKLRVGLSTRAGTQLTVVLPVPVVIK
jgi:hypothetical protein